jgi:hypothetical protein
VTVAMVHNVQTSAKRYCRNQTGLIVLILHEARILQCKRSDIEQLAECTNQDIRDLNKCKRFYEKHTTLIQRRFHFQERGNLPCENQLEEEVGHKCEDMRQYFDLSYKMCQVMTDIIQKANKGGLLHSKPINVVAGAIFWHSYIRFMKTIPSVVHMSEMLRISKKTLETCIVQLKHVIEV